MGGRYAAVTNVPVRYSAMWIWRRGCGRPPAAGDPGDRERGFEEDERDFAVLYTNFGRPSIVPEKLLRAGHNRLEDVMPVAPDQ